MKTSIYKLGKKLGKLTDYKFDRVPTEDSKNLVSSGDIKEFVSSKISENNTQRDEALAVALATNPNMTNVTYSQLTTLINQNKLVVGKFYRITDYVTKVKTNVTYNSAENAFDLIVLAIANNKLNAEAKAIQHTTSSSDYFYSHNLAAWRVWYDINNDTTKYDWAVNTGKGVIYRLIDENNNDCPYDFKNIRFAISCLKLNNDNKIIFVPNTGTSSLGKKMLEDMDGALQSTLATNLSSKILCVFPSSSKSKLFLGTNYYLNSDNNVTEYVYTFFTYNYSNNSYTISDNSRNCRNNVIKSYCKNSKYVLNNIVFASTTSSCYIAEDCYDMYIYKALYSYIGGDSYISYIFSNLQYTNITQIRKSILARSISYTVSSTILDCCILGVLYYINIQHIEESFISNRFGFYSSIFKYVSGCYLNGGRNCAINYIGNCAIGYMERSNINIADNFYTGNADNAQDDDFDIYDYWYELNIPESVCYLRLVPNFTTSQSNQIKYKTINYMYKGVWNSNYTITIESANKNTPTLYKDSSVVETILT